MFYVFELRLKVFLLQNINQKDAYSAIASFIDGTLTCNEKWARMHNENRYKNYCFNLFYKLEENGIYKKEGVYQILIRSTDKELIEYLSNKLPKYDNQWMKGLVCECRIMPRKHITSLYSITPVIVKGRENGYWRDNMTFEDFEERIKVNLIKKYAAIEQTKLDENFELHTLLELKNQGIITVPYKNIVLLADKIEMHIANNESAQKLAYMALATGVGEMNSRGFGFVNCHYM